MVVYPYIFNPFILHSKTSDMLYHAKLLYGKSPCIYAGKFCAPFYKIIIIGVVDFVVSLILVLLLVLLLLLYSS